MVFLGFQIQEYCRNIGVVLVLINTKGSGEDKWSLFFVPAKDLLGGSIFQVRSK
jgi:hypothetical protein